MKRLSPVLIAPLEVFTCYFLQGIKEKGDDMRAVYEYLKPEVSGYARRELNADQEPQWRQGK